tara:strand:- start:2062 stop:2325 length:264 start_codon:yes stop_codon:yes gene_type:complete
MKTLMMMTILAIMSATMVKSEEVKKDVVTEKVTETATVVKVWAENEWIDIKEYEKTNWEKGKEQNARNVKTIKSFFIKVQNYVTQSK